MIHTNLTAKRCQIFSGLYLPPKGRSFTPLTDKSLGGHWLKTEETEPNLTKP